MRSKSLRLSVVTRATANCKGRRTQFKNKGRASSSSSSSGASAAASASQTHAPVTYVATHPQAIPLAHADHPHKACNHASADTAPITAVISKKVVRPITREAPDGEGLFLQKDSGPVVNADNTIVDEKAKEMHFNTPEAGGNTPLKSRKNVKSNKEGRAMMTNENFDTVKKTPVSRLSVRKGKKKQEEIAREKKSTTVHDTSPNNPKTEDVATDKMKRKANGICLEQRKEEHEPPQQTLPIESKAAPLQMHVISHSISAMQKFGTLRSVSGYSSTSPDCCYISTSPGNSSNSQYHKLEGNATRNTSGGDGNGDDTTNNSPRMIVLPRQEPSERSPPRYSVEPPLTIPRESRKETTTIPQLQSQSSSFPQARGSSERAPSAPSHTPHSCLLDASPCHRERATHLSLEDALDGLRTDGILFPTRQLLTCSLASPAEKERTATIVFDLDETLCNNRCHGPAIIRPGAVEMLRRLRSLYPHPLLHPRETPVQPSVGGKYGKTTADSAGNSNNRQGTTTRGGSAAAGGGGVLYSASSPASSVASDGVTLRLELIIWTASVEVVARPVIARLDPDGTILDDVIYRDIRWYREGGYTKDLRRIGRYLDRIIIVENAPSSVSLNRRNAILVNDFVDNTADRQLIIVHAILQEWLENVNALVVFKHFQQLEQRRQRVQQDGGETPEPEQLVPASVVSQTHNVSARSSVSRSHGDVSHTSSTFFSAGNSLHELDLRASAIHFFMQHPFISPGTRYVRSSAWKQALKCIGEAPSTTTTCPAATTAAITAIEEEVGGGGGKHPLLTSIPIAATMATKTAKVGVKTATVRLRCRCEGSAFGAATVTGGGRSTAASRPRGHRLFATMGRGPREGL